ncbi:lambda exonuclease family protein [Silvimonas soli]|uniref:lambda exonuclease family protein n=1 Tax=Silvimonas soli TaxID=2980100 RepID=UPI0024B37D0F|nr:lambda exonuclease family protein [Silvimonas soli]
MEQRSPEWFAARLGKVTASRVADIMARTAKGYAASRQNYMAELLCERLTGCREDKFVNAAMARGTEKEPEARAIYMLRSGELVLEEGFVVHPELPEDFGISPDGLIGSDGLLEIKCPQTWTHIETIRTGEIKKEYVIQMQAQMACTGRQWCDFVSFDDRLPEELAYFQTRVERDDAFIAEMMGEIRLFLSDLNATVHQLNLKAA